MLLPPLLPLLLLLLTLGKMEDRSSGPRVEGPEAKGAGGGGTAVEAKSEAAAAAAAALAEGTPPPTVVLARLGRCDAADAFLLALLRSLAGEPGGGHGDGDR